MLFGFSLTFFFFSASSLVKLATTFFVRFFICVYLTLFSFFYCRIASFTSSFHHHVSPEFPLCTYFITSFLNAICKSLICIGCNNIDQLFTCNSVLKSCFHKMMLRLFPQHALFLIHLFIMFYFHQYAGISVYFHVNVFLSLSKLRVTIRIYPTSSTGCPKVFAKLF